MRAGPLRSRLEKDKKRVLKWMEIGSMDEVLKDGPKWWLMAISWAGGEMSEVVTMLWAVPEEVILKGIKTGDTPLHDGTVLMLFPRLGQYLTKFC